MTTSQLNEHQKRRVEVALFLLDRDLDEIVRLLTVESTEGTLYHVDRDVDDGARAQLLAGAKEIKGTITKLKARFELEPHVRSEGSAIAALLASLWVRIHDARPRNLAGFGDVNPKLYETLEPDLMRIIQVLRRMEGRLGSGPERVQEDGTRP